MNPLDKDDLQSHDDENKDPPGTSEATTNSESNKHPTASDDEDEDEPVYIEISPCSRWQKRRETVAQRDIPGIDASYLAMDTEEGVEVVWNEVLFSERKISETQHNKISDVFDKLIELNHMNIVKFHGYWQDRTKTDDRPRVVFITEYMSSGSLKHFLRKTKKAKQNLSKNSWRRWCIQLLAALNYLHSCEEPIIHGNLTCDTIFIQNNGLVKIGSIHYPQLRVFADLGIVAPDVLHRHVKSLSDASARNLHFQAPEIDDELNALTTAVDIYSLGMVTLEMINLDLGGNGDIHTITDEVINEAIVNLDNPLQKDLILKCLEPDPSKRPTARELLFHRALFEIPSLKLLAVHGLADDIRLKPDRSFVSPTVRPISLDEVFAELESSREGLKPIVYTYKDCPPFDLDKLLEDVQNGLYPITAYHLLYPTQSSLNVPTKPSSVSERNLTSSTSSLSSLVSTNAENDSVTPVQSVTDPSIFHGATLTDSTLINSAMKSRTTTVSSTTHHERTGSIIGDIEMTRRDSQSINTAVNLPSSSISNPIDEKENRRLIDIQCKIKTKDTGLCMLYISVKFPDRLQRDMSTEIDHEESAPNIARELLDLGLIHENDYPKVEQALEKALTSTLSPSDLLSSAPSTSLLDVKKTAVVAATAALITAQALQNQMNTPTAVDTSNPFPWAQTNTNPPTQPVMYLPH